MAEAKLREPKIVVRVGKKGVGKTYQALKFFEEKYIKNLPGKVGRKVLIFDTNKEFETVMPIRFQDLKLFKQQSKIEIRRILPIDPVTRKPLGLDGKVEILERMLDEVGLRDIGLYLEDFNSYMIGATSKKIINLLTTNRHYSLDLFISFQTLRALPPRILGNTNIVAMHKTYDDIDQIKNKIPNYELTKVANILVDNIYEENERFFCYIDYDLNKIYGNFTKAQFELAIDDYLWEFAERKIKMLIRRKNITQQEAFDQLRNKLIKDYTILKIAKP